MKEKILKSLANNLSPINFAKIKRIYLHIRHGKIPKGLNFKNPKTFNEKINYLKLYHTKKTGSPLADKIDAKDYVKNIVGEKYLIPTIAIYNNTREIDWDILPNSFVIKASHSSGMNFICPNKEKIDKEKILNIMNKWLENDYQNEGGEWQYNLEPRLICEEYIENTKEKPLMDYKFYCFNGIAKFVQVDTDRFSKHSRNIYDLNWNLQPFEFLYPNSDYKIEKPNNFTEMIKIAEKLSQDRCFFRIDLYNHNGNIYFGEITFHPDGGCGYIEPYEYDIKLGNFIDLGN